MRYYQPPFKEFKPFKLKQILKKITEKNNFLKYDVTNDELKLIISMIINKEKLTTKKIEIVLYNINKIIVILQQKKINLFFKLLIFQIKITRNLNIDIILKLIYNNIIRFYSMDKFYEETFKEMGKVLLLNNGSDDINSNIYKYFLQEKSFIFFLKEEFLIYINRNNSYENFNNLYRISIDGNIYMDLVYFLFVNNIDSLLDKGINDKLVNLFKNNIINMEEKKYIYNEIFNYYSAKDISEYSYDWFELIYTDLGNPNKKIENWYGILEEYIDLMKVWLINAKLEEVFSKIYGDEERLRFWKQYVKYLTSVDFIENLNGAIIMKTINHIFIEFGETGNALFIYKNNKENLSELNKIKNFTNKSDTVKILKNLSYDKAKFSHSGSWFYKFQEKLSHLGYENDKSYYYYY